MLWPAAVRISLEPALAAAFTTEQLGQMAAPLLIWCSTLQACQLLLPILLWAALC